MKRIGFNYIAWKPEIHRDYTKYLLRRVLSTLGSMIAEIIGKKFTQIPFLYWVDGSFIQEDVRDLKRSGRQRQGKLRLKMNFCLKLEFKKWLHLFTVSYGATPQLQHNVEEKEALSSKWKLKQFAVAVSVRRRRKLWWFHVVVLHRTAKKCTKF